MRRAQPWLGTLVGIEATGLPPAQLARAIDRAFAAVARVHALMSFHEPGSELSRLNRAAHAGPVPVSGHLRRVLRAACRLSALTDGRFDVTVAPTLVRWGYLPGSPDSTEPTGDWRDIRLGTDGTVRFARPLLIDLGGIAKGYAVDLAIASLRRAGVPQACVNAGGDLRFYGREPRRIGVRDPADPARLRLLPPLLQGAVATSCVADTRRRHGRDLALAAGRSAQRAGLRGDRQRDRAGPFVPVRRRADQAGGHRSGRLRTRAAPPAGARPCCCPRA